MSFGGCCKRERRSVNQVCTSARTQPARQRVASRTRPAWRRRRRAASHEERSASTVTLFMCLHETTGKKVTTPYR